METLESLDVLNFECLVELGEGEVNMQRLLFLVYISPLFFTVFFLLFLTVFLLFISVFVFIVF